MRSPLPNGWSHERSDTSQLCWWPSIGVWWPERREGEPGSEASAPLAREAAVVGRLFGWLPPVFTSSFE